MNPRCVRIGFGMAGDNILSPDLLQSSCRSSSFSFVRSIKLFFAKIEGRRICEDYFGAVEPHRLNLGMPCQRTAVSLTFAPSNNTLERIRCTAVVSHTLSSGLNIWWQNIPHVETVSGQERRLFDAFVGRSSDLLVEIQISHLAPRISFCVPYVTVDLSFPKSIATPPCNLAPEKTNRKLR